MIWRGTLGTSLRLLTLDGTEKVTITGLNNCETVGAIHGVVMDARRRRVYLRELVKDRVTAIGLDGRVVYRADLAASALATQISNAFLHIDNVANSKIKPVILSGTHSFGV